MNEAERTAGLPPTAQYQYAQRAGNQLFVAGQVPHDPNGGWWVWMTLVLKLFSA